MPDRVLIVVSNHGGPALTAAAPPEGMQGADLVIGLNRFATEGVLLKNRWSADTGAVEVVNRGLPEDTPAPASPLQRFFAEAAVPYREYAENQKRWDEHVQREKDRADRAEAELGEVRRRLDDRTAALAQVAEQRDTTEAVLAELQHHSGRLVELLRDAWWVEAARHLKELGELT